MVQVIRMNQGQTLGGAFGEGISRGTSASLNMLMQDMMETKNLNRKLEANKQATSAILTSMGRGDMVKELGDQLKYIDPQTGMGLAQMLNRQKLSSFASTLDKAYTGEPITNNVDVARAGEAEPSNLQLPKMTHARSLQPGQAPMLPYEQMPAQEELTPKSMTGMAAAAAQREGSNIAPEEVPKAELSKEAPPLETNPVQYDKQEQDRINQIVAQARKNQLSENEQAYLKDWQKRMETKKNARVSLLQKQQANTREQKNQDLEIEARKTKRFEPLVTNYLKAGEESEKLVPNFETSIIQNEKMKTSPASWDAIVESVGDQYPWMRNFVSTNAQILQAQTPAFIADFKGKMGGVLTDAKINLIAKKVAGVGKDKGANRLILYMGYLDKKLDIIRAEKTNEIIEKNDGLIPKDFDKKLKFEMSPYRKNADKDITRLLNDKIPISDLSKTALGAIVHKKLPLAKEYSGKTATDTRTGKKYKSDGNTWKEVQ